MDAAINYYDMNVSKEVFTSCNRRAWLGWNDKLQLLQQELTLKYPGHVHLGEE